MNSNQLLRWTGRLLSAIIFGAAFWLLTELSRDSLSGFTGGSSCCQRCTDFLYHSAQPVLALCAGAAFFCQSFISSTRGRLKQIVFKSVVCWLCFQIFSGWTAWHLLHRTPCTALYSPGPILPIGAVVVVVVLLIESTVWMSICALMILPVEVVKAMLRRDEAITLSIKA
jgi:uncharacterized membrane protein